MPFKSNILRCVVNVNHSSATCRSNIDALCLSRVKYCAAPGPQYLAGNGYLILFLNPTPQYLAGNGYEGLVLLDDIYLNQAMDRVWGSQPGCKYDLTDLGHTVAGTGLLDFSCAALAAVMSSFPP